MIRGLIGIVPHHTMAVGRFYMAPDYNGKPWLFQCIQTAEPLDDSFRQKALFMTTGGVPDIELSGLPSSDSVIALQDVHVRIDPTSLSGGPSQTHPHRGLFLIRDDEAIICAPTDQLRGWTAVNINTGRTVTDIGRNWMGFTRWSLVMDDEAGDELTIASFGENGPEPA